MAIDKNLITMDENLITIDKNLIMTCIYVLMCLFCINVKKKNPIVAPTGTRFEVSYPTYSQEPLLPKPNFRSKHFLAKKERKGAKHTQGAKYTQTYTTFFIYSHPNKHPVPPLLCFTFPYEPNKP